MQNLRRGATLQYCICLCQKHDMCLNFRDSNICLYYEQAVVFRQNIAERRETWYTEGQTMRRIIVNVERPKRSLFQKIFKHSCMYILYFGFIGMEINKIFFHIVIGSGSIFSLCFPQHTWLVSSQTHFSRLLSSSEALVLNIFSKHLIKIISQMIEQVCIHGRML